jgi:hypothetical protein
MPCSCNLARYGMLLLVFAAYLAASPPQGLMGVNPSAVLHAALNGDVSPAAWCWLAYVALGLWLLISGLHAAFDHDDPVDWRSVLWSTGVISFVVYSFYLYTSVELSPAGYGYLHALLVAWAAGNCLNIVLQTRSLFGQREIPVHQPAPTPSTGWMRRRSIRIEEEEIFHADDTTVSQTTRRIVVTSRTPAHERIVELEGPPPVELLPGPDVKRNVISARPTIKTRK